MYKKVFGVVLAFCILASISVSASEIALVFNGEVLQSDTSPVLEGDQILVPIRIIAEKYGASVSWDGASALVTIIKDNRACLITIGADRVYTFEGDSFYGMEVYPSPVIINDRTMVPLSVLIDCFGMDAHLSEGNSAVYITVEPSPEAAAPSE